MEDIYRRNVHDDELSLEYYEMNITYDSFSAAHNNFITITEIYCPELNLSFNKINNEYNFILNDNDRYNQKNKPKLLNILYINRVSHTAQILMKLVEFYKNKKQLEKNLDKLFN